jgi:hypothetical protein
MKNRESTPPHTSLPPAHEPSSLCSSKRNVFSLVALLLLFFNALNLVDNHKFLAGVTEIMGFVETKGLDRSVSVNSYNHQTPSEYRVPCNGTAFDEIVEAARIFTFHGSRQPPPRRDAFDVSAWKHKGSGGLTDNDRAMLGRIYGRAQSVFEYGLGESTRIADAVGVPRYAGLDSDPNYVANTRSKVASHFRFYFGDIGPTKNWGYATENLTKAVWNYQLAPLLSEPEPFDVYMVDGRYRFPCLVASFLHASARGEANLTHTTVLMHDCFRDYYHRADEILDLFEESGDRLCAYRRKPETKDADLIRLWKQYFVDWD